MQRLFSVKPLCFLICTLSGVMLGFQTKSDSLMQLGLKQYAGGRYSEAVRSFLQAAPDSGNAWTHYSLGLAYAGMNDVENASKFLKLAVREDSVNVSYRLQLAQFLTRVTVIDDAVLQYETIIALDSSFYPAYAQLGQVCELWKKGDVDYRSRVWKRALQLNPRDYLAHYYYAIGLHRLELRDSVLSHLKMALELNPNYFPAAEDLARILLSEKNYAEAFFYYERAVQLRPQNAKLLFDIGEAYRRTGDYSNAIVFLKKAIKADSLNSLYHAQLGLNYFYTAGYDSSVMSYHRAISLESENPTYYLNLALAFDRMDSTDRAAGAFLGAVRAYRPDQIADVYSRLGAFYFKRGKYDSAAAAYKKALQFDPSDRDALVILAETYEILKNTREAIRRYNEYLELAAHDSTQRFRIDYIESRLRELKKK